MSKKDMERYYARYLTISQGDLVLINFGKKTAGCRNGGIKPCVVVSNDSSIKTEADFFVIPLYRKQSRSAGSRDILIKPVHCRGLRYEEYAHPMNMVSCHKCRVTKKIGHIKNASILEAITLSIWDMVKDSAG
jgi:mRNA-degrading endonuclease toxin of MazEF toxin-antitoxin module